MSWKSETLYYSICTALFYLYNLTTQFLLGQANGTLFYGVTGTATMVASSRSIGLPKKYAIPYYSTAAVSLYYYNNTMLSALGRIIGGLIYNVSATVVMIVTTHFLLSMVHTSSPLARERINAHATGLRKGMATRSSRYQRS